MKKRNDWLGRAASGGRMPKVIMVMMLSFMMILSGIAPSFYAFAEDAAEDAAVSTEEAAAPAAEEESAEEVSSPEPAAAEPEPEPAPEPEPEPEPEPVSPSDTQTVNNEEAPSPSDVDADPAVTSTDKAADTEKDADTEDADKDRKDEEEKYPAQDFSGSTSDLDISVSAGKGVFPDGTQMKVRGASAEEVKEAAQKMAGEGAEVVDAAAADITFWNEGKEIQPKKAVRVRLGAKRALAGDSHEAVTVSDSGNASVMSDASASSASFRTDHFTVYGITGTEYADDISKNVRYTYVFYDEEKPVSTQIVKQGEKVILPEVEDSEKFRWVDKATGDEVTNDTMVPEDATEDKTIDVVKAFDRWHGIFYTSSDAGTVCMTREADKGVVELITKEDFENMGLVPEGQSFIGWREKDKTDTDIIAGAAVEVNGADIHLVPVFRDDLKVTLDANGGEFKTADENGEASGSAALTLSVRYEDKIDFSDIPVRAGYKLREPAWYRNKEATDPWDPDNMATDNVTLYAGWEEAENSFILSVMRENAQNNNYSEKEHREWASNNGTALKTGDPIPVSAILAQYGKDKYKSDHYHLNGAGAKQDDLRFKDSCPAIEVYHGGTKVAAFDHNGECIEGDSAKAVIADRDTVVKVYYSLDSYQLFFRFDPELSKDNMPVNGYNGGTQLSKERNRTAYNDYRDLMGTDWITGQSDQVLKYGEWMYAKAYGNNPRIRKLLDEGTHWWFDAVYRGSSGQQVVFNASNMYNPFRPEDKTPDGQGVLILVKYDSRQKAHQIIDVYYDAAGKEAAENPPITINYRAPRKHEFRIGSVVGGYELKEVTGPYDSNTNKYLELEAEPPQANGQIKFAYLYKEDGEPLPMICHWYPAEYTITYVQVKAGAVDIAEDCKETDQQQKVLFGESTDAAAEAQPSGGKWNVIKDKNGIRYDFDGIEVYTKSGKKLGSMPEKMPSSDLIVYYRWTPEKFRVDYDPDNGDPVLTDSDIPANGRTKGYENLPGAEELKNEELEFRGWYECDDEGKPVSRFDFSTRIMKNYRLKAVWEPTDIYKVRYDANGGTLPDGLVDGMDPKAYRRDSDAKTVGSAKPGEGKNSRFIGWAVGTEKDKLITGSTFRVSAVNDAADGKSDNVITLVARYVTYKQKTTVVYHTNYPAGEENRTFETKPLDVNKMFKVLTIQDAGWSDTYAFNGKTYKFVCWTSAGGERLYVRSAGRDYFFPDELAAAGRWENDLYAVWEELPEVKNGIVAPTDTTDGDVLGDYEDDGTDDNDAGSADIVRTAETSQPAASSGVKTGDETRLIAYIGIMIAAIILSLIIMAARRRRDLQ